MAKKNQADHGDRVDLGERIDHRDRIDLATAELETYHFEDAEDSKILRGSLWGAVGFHAVLLLINFPAFVKPPIAEAETKKVFVVQQVQLKQPPILKTEIPERKIKRKPAPDPTPDLPEPLPVDEPEPELDLPAPDVGLFVIPDAPPAPPDPGPIEVGGEVKRPEKIYAPMPQYTEIARRTRIQGVVIVQAIIDKQGTVTNVKVVKGLSMGLTEASVQTIKTWKFKPATLHGKPVDVYFNLTVNFQLQ